MALGASSGMATMKWWQQQFSTAAYSQDLENTLLIFLATKHIYHMGQTFCVSLAKIIVKKEEKLRKMKPIDMHIADSLSQKEEERK